MIFGNLNLILEPGVKNESDLIYSRGPFTLIKNNSIKNNLIKADLIVKGTKFNFVDVYSSDKSFAFDETYGLFKIFRKANKNVYHNASFVDINPNTLFFLVQI